MKSLLTEKLGLKFMVFDHSEGKGLPWHKGRWIVSDEGIFSSGLYRHLLDFEWDTACNLAMFDIEYEAMDVRLESAIGIPPMFFHVSVPTNEKLGTLIQGISNPTGEKMWSHESVYLFRVSMSYGGVQWNVFHPSMSWSNGTPRWRHGDIKPVDAIFGERRLIHDEIIDVQNVDVPMPEGTYRWTIKRMKRTVGRKRLPWSDTIYAFEADCHEGHQIPIPGKGENSWDCGPDATYGLYATGSDIAEIIGKIVAGALKTRSKRGAHLTYSTGGRHDKESRATA